MEDVSPLSFALLPRPRNPKRVARFHGMINLLTVAGIILIFLALFVGASGKTRSGTYQKGHPAWVIPILTGGFALLAIPAGEGFYHTVVPFRKRERTAGIIRFNSLGMYVSDDTGTRLIRWIEAGKVEVSFYKGIGLKPDFGMSLFNSLECLRIFCEGKEQEFLVANRSIEHNRKGELFELLEELRDRKATLHEQISYRPEFGERS